MKLSKLFDARVIVSSMAASILTGLVMFYGANKIPGLRDAQRGLDGARA